jgi:hypothetical protein
MKRILLIALFLLCTAGTASAYQLYLSCPESVQVGLPLKCSIDSNLPAGTTFNLGLYQSGYTATAISLQAVTIQDDKATQYRLFDTKGLPGGQYKVEIQNMDESRLSTDSKTLQLPVLIDRSGEITITSPMTQNMDEALRIEGYIEKLGDEGVEIAVRGPDGVIIGPRWIGTKENVQSGAGVFTQHVPVNGPGEYDVTFSDAKGYIGVVTFNVVAPVTMTPTTIPETTLITTTRVPTTVPTTMPTPTKSPLSSLPIVAALGLISVLSVILAKKR